MDIIVSTSGTNVVVVYKSPVTSVGPMKSTPRFDLVFDLPRATGLSEEQKGRLRKENEQLEKVIANSKRQLENESFVSKAPAKVIEGMRAKLAEYEAQLAKNKAALGE